MQMKKRFFTVQEARQLLPSLKELMGKVMVISHRLEEYREVVQQLADSASSNTGGPKGTGLPGHCDIPSELPDSTSGNRVRSEEPPRRTRRFSPPERGT